MKKSDLNHPPCYYDRYIQQVEDIEISEAFQLSLAEHDQLDLKKLNALGNQTYAEGKWTIQDIFQHLIDTERILAYRALRFARNDKTPLTGFDEALLAANVKPQARSLDHLLTEMKIVRQSTALMFASFDEVASLRLGIASDIPMSALAFGFTILGHQKHHLKSIEANYIPLIANQ